VLGQEREVGIVSQRDLGAGDGGDARGFGHLGELHRAVEAVVVGQGESFMALLRRRRGQLHRVRGAVQERVGGVAVKLDI
jgi:hypothetical protein